MRSLLYPEPSPVTRALAARLLPRADEIGTVLRDAIRIKSSPYAHTDLVSLEELTRSCRENILRALQGLAGTVPTSEDILDAALTTARRRADVGFPLDSLLQAYRIGAEVLWAALLAEARSQMPEALDELLDSAVQVMQLIDRMSVAVADEYRTRELQATRRLIERRQAVLDGLLEGRAADPDFAAEAMRVLALPEQARLAIVVVRHRPDASRPPDSPAEALAADGFVSEWRLRADHEVGLVVLGEAPLDRLVARLHSAIDGWAGVSDEMIGLADAGSEFRMAEMALASLPSNAPRITTLAERLPEVLITSNRPVALRIRERAFGGLLGLPAEKREPLIATLDRWFANNRSTSDTAAEMHCHRNTVLYRLNRIEELTGSRLDDPRDQFLLRLALMVP